MNTPRTLFQADKPCVYTMPPSAAFLDELARGLQEDLGDQLSSAMILLPTRRAIRTLEAAFVRANKGRAALLPIMRTLADLDENEPPFAPAHLDVQIPAAIDPTRAQFELATLCARKIQAAGAAAQKENPVDAASALAMSVPLAVLLNDLASSELDGDVLDHLDEGLEKLPVHFQHAGEFAKIVAHYWPQFLKEQGMIEGTRRRIALLNAACEIWQDRAPDHPVIIAGSTGSMGATARLIKCVANLPKGLVVLPGLDLHMDDQAWGDIDDQHPQAGLKNLLNIMNIGREGISLWPRVSVSHKAQMRSKIVSESLIPANATSDWPARIARMRTSVSEGSPLKEGLSGLSLIEAKTDEEEAGLIALILRGVLEEPGKTGILVTPDPALARRVQAKLSRWGVEINSSAGEPLEETQHGSFLSLSLQAASDPSNPLLLSGLVKHALFAGDISVWDAFEKAALRGPRPLSTSAIQEKLDGKYAEGFALFESVQAALRPLHAMLETVNGVNEMARAHIQLVEGLAGGAPKLWCGAAGEQAALLAEELLLYGDLLPPVDGQGYAKLLSQLMRGRVVRPRTGMNARLQILGPLEARMAHGDVFVLGGLNEGVWPAASAPNSVLSAHMRAQIGLGTSERRFGLAAHDFAQLAGKDKVVLTRSRRTGDGPSVQSRWLWRLTTLVRGALADEGGHEGVGGADVLAGDTPWLDWTRMLDAAPTNPTPAKRPAPCPPLEARWPEESGGRRLSVTQIQTWVRDPYAIYAKKILRLSPLDPLDQTLGGREYGSAVHKALEALEGADSHALSALLAKELAQAGFAPSTFSRHTVRLQAMATWLAGWADARREDGWHLWSTEKKGAITLTTENELFVLSGTADRIEKRGNDFAVLDYKTGMVPNNKIVQTGFDPQLPLLGVMLSFGAFGDKVDATDFLYIKPNARAVKDREQSRGVTKEADEFLGDAYENLQNLIAHFDDPKNAYYSQPRAQYVNPYGDYDHLARRSEWATLGTEGEDK